MQDAQIWVVAVSVGMSVSITAVALVVVARKRRGGVGGLAVGKGRAGSGSGTVDGVEYRYAYTPSSKNRASSLAVWVDCQSEGAYRLSRETGFDRFFKRLGVCCEISTGDDAFDEKFYITTDTVEFAREYFGNPQKREAATRVHGLGFTQLSLGKGGLRAVRSPFNLKKDFDSAMVENVASALVALSRDLPSVRSAGRFGMGDDWKTRRALAFVVTVLCVACGFAGLLLGLTKYQPLDGLAVLLDSLTWSVPSMLVWGWLCMLLVRGRSSSHRELLVLWVLSLTGVPLAGFGGPATLNGMLDQSAAVEHEATVVDTYISRSDKSTTYYAVVESWRSGRGTEKISVSSWEYGKLKPRESALTVVTKPGRFGYEWLVDSRIKAP